MRILSAGRGPRMMGMVARLADAANIAWMGRPTDPVLVERMAALDRACEAIGRDPATLERTVGVSVRYPDAVVGRPEPGSRQEPRRGARFRRSRWRMACARSPTRAIRR